MTDKGYTYCIARVPGGMSGSHPCGNRIPLGTTICPTCSNGSPLPYLPVEPGLLDLPELP